MRRLAELREDVGAQLASAGIGTFAQADWRAPRVPFAPWFTLTGRGTLGSSIDPATPHLTPAAPGGPGESR